MNLLVQANSWPIKMVRSRLSQPVASITFDGFPRSAWTCGGQILARRRAKATYYVAGSFCMQRLDGLDYFDADDLRAVYEAGHEIGCQTFWHHQGRPLSSKALGADIERNAEFVGDILGDVRLASFAYPYGHATPRSKARLAELFPTARGTRTGINAGVLDLAQLKAVPLQRNNWRADKISSLVEASAAQRAWIIFFSNDVSEDPSPYGCTPQMLDHALDCLERARVPVLSVKHALARATFG